LEGESLSVVNESRLHSTIWTRGEVDLAPRYARYRNDGRLLALLQERQGRVYQPDGTHHVNGECLAPALFICANRQSTHVCHDDVQPTESLGDLPHPGLQRRPVGNIQCLSQRAAAASSQGAHRFLNVSRAASAYSYLRTFLDKEFCDGAATTLRGSRDKHARSLQTQIHDGSCQLFRYTLRMPAPTEYLGSTKLPRRT